MVGAYQNFFEFNFVFIRIKHSKKIVAVALYSYLLYK
jgi:hypothetical protein